MPLPAEEPTSAEAFLEAFPSLNPFSAAIVASSITVKSLMSLMEGELERLLKVVPGVSKRSLHLLLWQLTWGQVDYQLAGMYGN